MPVQDLWDLSIVDAAAAFRRRQLSPVELTHSLLDRIEALDGQLHTFVTVTADLALQQARRAEAELLGGTDRGPLHGIPIALKDLYATAGVRTTAHSKVLADWVPDQDATAVTLLADAGAVLLGKLAMHEFAFGGPAHDTPFPPARNPWNPACIPGGSSSGSGAALAAGLCLGSLGSDTGGSIRNPSALCGVVGLKPTYGRVSRHGLVPLSWSLDHAGPMARTVEDCALLLQAIAGYDRQDAASAKAPVPDYRADLASGVRGLRLGVPRSWFATGEVAAQPAVLTAVEIALGTLEQAGAAIVEVDGAAFAAARNAHSTILLAEAYAYHEQNLATRPQDYGSSVRRRFLEGAFLSAADYVQAQRVRRAIVDQVAEILATVDALVMPMSRLAAPPFAGLDAEVIAATLSYAGAFNLTGLPALAIPCGFSADGLPFSLQIAGRPFDEATVLRVGYAYEQATGWGRRRPPIQPGHDRSID